MEWVGVELQGKRGTEEELGEEGRRGGRGRDGVKGRGKEKRRGRGERRREGRREKGRSEKDDERWRLVRLEGGKTVQGAKWADEA